MANHDLVIQIANEHLEIAHKILAAENITSIVLGHWVSRELYEDLQRKYTQLYTTIHPDWETRIGGTS